MTKEKPKINYYPFWSPRVWHGMELGDWLKLVARNRFRIHPLRWSLATTITCMTGLNSVLNRWQRLRFERLIQATEITEPPLFILGHWRSGTTHLHELMSLDENLQSPTTYQCFAPRHFLTSEWFVTRFFWFLVPARRPMDNMQVTWQKPQEDEFALMSMGLPTPYHRMAFPNHPPPHLEYLDMSVSEEEMKRWQEGLRWFAQALTLHTPKRIVFKSPPHLGRIKAILGAFPDARFIHITRNPYQLFASTLHVWESMDAVQGLQIRNDIGREEFVFDTFERMYAAFEQQRTLLAPSQIVDVRYEDLIADPVGEIELIYERLDLGDFQKVRPVLEDYLAKQKDYKTNRHPELPEDVMAEIDRRWLPYLNKYGYDRAGQRRPAPRGYPAREVGAR